MHFVGCVYDKPSLHHLEPIEFEGIERQAGILNYTSAHTYESEMICFDPSDESMHGQEQISMRAEVWTGEDRGDGISLFVCSFESFYIHNRKI